LSVRVNKKLCTYRWDAIETVQRALDTPDLFYKLFQGIVRQTFDTTTVHGTTWRHSARVLGVRQYASCLLEFMFEEANAGFPIRAADLAAWLLATTAVPRDGYVSTAPILAEVFSDQSESLLLRLRTESEAAAFAHFTIAVRLYTMAVLPVLASPPPSPVFDPTFSWKQTVSNMPLTIQATFQAVVQAASPPLVAELAIYSHPAARLCLPQVSSAMALGLRRLGREDLFLLIFDLTDPVQRETCARLFAFPTPPELRTPHSFDPHAILRPSIGV